MNNCKFAPICKFFEFELGEDERLEKANLLEKVRLLEKAPKKVLPKKRGGDKKGKIGKAGKKITNLSTSKEDIRRIRMMLTQEKKRGRLDENQVAALDSIGRTNYENLTDGQKEQLLNIYNGPRRTKNG